MNQLSKIWANLSLAQRMTLVILPLVVGCAIFGLVHWKHESDFRTLYTGLAPEDAATITQKMREGAIEYRLDETGSTVSVAAPRLAEARLALAGAGLPKTGRIGFEIFDRTNLGATDFAEQVNYRRALEGELERTLATLSQVEQARVHITVAKDSVFLESRQPSKATVVVRLRRSSRLTQSVIVSISNLVSSAVEGLSADKVAVIDSSGQLLSRVSRDDSDAQLAEANLDYRHRIESELLSKVNSSLEPLLGENRFRAGINVECDFTSAEQNDETVDPNGSVVTTSQSTEETSGSGIASGVPGAASNLPRPASRPGSGVSGLTRRTENLAYQTSRTVRRVMTPKGTIRRVSAAVLIDQNVRWEGVGAKAKKVLIPASPEVVKGVRDIVAGILGFTEKRGDQITVETLPFENTLSSEQPLPAAPVEKADGKLSTREQTIIGGATLVLVLMGALVFFLRGKNKPAAVEDTSATAIPGAVPASLEAAAESAVTVPGYNSHEDRVANTMSTVEAQQAQLEEEAMSRIKLPANSKATELLLRHVREAIQKDSIGVTNILRAWVAEPAARKVGRD